MVHFACSSIIQVYAGMILLSVTPVTVAFHRAGFVAYQTASRIRSYPISSIGRCTIRTASLQEEIDPGKVQGTDLRIVKYPHPCLRRKNDDVTADELKSGVIVQLAKEMFLVMYAANGIGLAAPQIGINKRLMVFNESGDKKRWLDEAIFVNPRIVESSEATELAGEACLSFPDMGGEVLRHKWIKVEALNAKGKKIKKKFLGFTARLFQHEYDHLDGIVYIDRLSAQGRFEIQQELDKLVKEFGEGGEL